MIWKQSDQSLDLYRVHKVPGRTDGRTEPDSKSPPTSLGGDKKLNMFKIHWTPEATQIAGSLSSQTSLQIRHL